VRVPLGCPRATNFAPTIDAAPALEFYRDNLGLTLLSKDGFASVFDAHVIILRLSNILSLTAL